MNSLLDTAIAAIDLNSPAQATSLNVPLQGLRAQYYDNKDLTNLKFTRTDATVNFNWGTASPNTSMGSDTFSARWMGQVQTQFTQRYTFYTQADDGVRLWVDGKLLIDHWNDHAVTEDQGSIDLVAGKRYNIRLEYYDNLRRATCNLLWSSSSQVKQIIPTSALFATPTSTDTYTFSGKDILQNGKLFTPQGMNAMHSFGGDTSQMSGWKINTVREFLGSFRDNPIDGSAIQVNGTWLHSIESVVQDNRANGKVTILCPFGWDGTQDTMFTGTNPSQTPWWRDYLAKYQQVATHFKNQSDVWFEVWNEPYAWNRSNGYSDQRWLQDMQVMIQNIRSTQATNAIVIPGAEQGQDESVILRYGKTLAQQDSSLIFDIHAYEKWLSQPQSIIEARMQALKATNLPFLFGEIGPLNVDQPIDPKPFLNAAKAQGVGLLGWVWKTKNSSTDINAFFNPDGTLNNQNNFNWATQFQQFLQSAATVRK
jgi:mannan endo-1,4-beta-mannosidase